MFKYSLEAVIKYNKNITERRCMHWGTPQKPPAVGMAKHHMDLG